MITPTVKPTAPSRMQVSTIFSSPDMACSGSGATSAFPAILAVSRGCGLCGLPRRRNACGKAALCSRPFLCGYELVWAASGLERRGTSRGHQNLGRLASALPLAAKFPLRPRPSTVTSTQTVGVPPAE